MSSGAGIEILSHQLDVLADYFSLNARTRDPVWNEEFKLNVKDPASQYLQVCMCPSVF